MTPDEAISRAIALPCFRAPSGARLVGGGKTNLNIRVEDGGCAFVVRLGADIPEHHILRWSELAITRAAAAAGIGPAVLHAEPGVLVLDWIEAEPFDEAAVRAPENLLALAALLRRCHTEVAHHLRGPVLSFNVFHILRDYAATLTERGSPHAALLPGLLDQAEGLERRVGPQPLVLGHNDLLPSNILRDRVGRLWLIDWEYAGFTTPIFDLGGLASNAGMDRAGEAALLSAYHGAPPDAALLARYDAMKCASLLRETLWSMISELTSTLDFDYAAYTAQNLAAYRAAHSCLAS
ncbi:MAG: phosphotransferase [Gemmobacter sp.]|jgi:thiamine kinase-like enzyme|nr:phosphotransferase [Gemmobacter sp.]